MFKTLYFVFNRSIVRTRRKICNSLLYLKKCVQLITLVGVHGRVVRGVDFELPAVGEKAAYVRRWFYSGTSGRHTSILAWL